jgi:hypothetical protein
MDQVKQTADNAFMVDMFQFMLCGCIGSRMIFQKCTVKDEIEGFGKSCSIATDCAVILAF